MRYAMINIDIEGLLGLEFNNPKIQDAIEYFALPKKRPIIPKGDLNVGIESKTKGVDINFTPIENIEFLNQVDYPEGSLLVTAIFLYRDGVQDHRGFEQNLPQGLSFKDSRADVRKALGDPSWSSPMLPIDRWVFGRYKIVVDFSEDGEQIDTVTLQLISE